MLARLMSDGGAAIALATKATSRLRQSCISRSRARFRPARVSPPLPTHRPNARPRAARSPAEGRRRGTRRRSCVGDASDPAMALDVVLGLLLRQSPRETSAVALDIVPGGVLRQRGRAPYAV